MSSIDQIRSIVSGVEKEHREAPIFPKRLTELREAEKNELEPVIRDPQYFLDWVQENAPHSTDLALKILDRVRYVSKIEMVSAANQLATEIEAKAQGRNVILLADFTGSKSRKSTWLMRELAGRDNWQLEYPQDIDPSRSDSFYVFFDDASLSGARARLTVQQALERGATSANILVAIAGLTQKANESLERDGLPVVSSFEIPTIDKDFSPEETQEIEMLSDMFGFPGGAERILTFMFHKVSDNFWQPLKRSGCEETYLIDDHQIRPPYYSKNKDLMN